MLIGSATGSTSIASMPTHAAGDLLYAVAWRLTTGSVTPPDGWSEIFSTSANLGGALRNRYHYYKIAASSSEVSGTWIGAAALFMVVLRGAVSPYFGDTDVNTSAGSTTCTVPELTLTYPGESWIVATGRHDTGGSLDNNPTGMTGIYYDTTPFQKHTARRVSSWSAASFTASDTSDWNFTDAVEFRIRGGSLFGAFP